DVCPHCRGRAFPGSWLGPPVGVKSTPSGLQPRDPVDAGPIRAGDVDAPTPRVVPPHQSRKGVVVPAAQEACQKFQCKKRRSKKAAPDLDYALVIYYYSTVDQ